MIIDQFTLIVGIIVILLAILASLASPFLRRIKIYESDNNENSTTVPVSIIIPVHDESTDLKRNLPAFLNQDYQGDFKIIVVADKDDRETEDLMNRLMPENKNLYATYLPESSRYMSRKKLAITIGVKAAGGIRDLDSALALIQAGATRLGTSSGIQIVEAYKELKKGL